MLVETQQAKRTNRWERRRRRKEEMLKWTRGEILLLCSCESCVCVCVRMQCQHSLTKRRTFITSRSYLALWQNSNVRIPLTHTRKHRCTLMCWPCVCCDRHGRAGCRFLCLALTSMSLAETRRDRGPHQYLNSLTSHPPDFCSFLLFIPTFPSCLLFPIAIYPSSSLPGHSCALSVPFVVFFYISDCVIYSLSFLFVSVCVVIGHTVLPAVPDYLV